MLHCSVKPTGRMMKNQWPKTKPKTAWPGWERTEKATPLKREKKHSRTKNLFSQPINELSERRQHTGNVQGPAHLHLCIIQGISSPFDSFSSHGSKIWSPWTSSIVRNDWCMSMTHSHTFWLLFTCHSKSAHSSRRNGARPQGHSPKKHKLKYLTSTLGDYTGLTEF